MKLSPTTHLRLTVEDCLLDGQQITLDHWQKLSSAQLALVVGTQAPDGGLEDAADYNWEFRSVSTEDLKLCGHDGEEPVGGWGAAYLRQLAEDRTAVENGSPQCEGRDAWIKNVWLADTRTYPIYLVMEPEGFRIWDGHHRLAGAQFYGAPEISALVGIPKAKP